MSYYSDPEWREAAEENAARAATLVFIRAAARRGSVTVVVTLIAIAIDLTAFHFTVESVGVVPRWAYWPTWVYVATFSVTFFVVILKMLKDTAVERRAIRNGHPHVDIRPPSLAWLNRPIVWVARASAAPAAFLAYYCIAKIGMNSGLAVSLATVGWLAPDVALLVTFPARKGLFRLAELAKPRPLGGP
jgi:hypothetical protein